MNTEIATSLRVTLRAAGEHAAAIEAWAAQAAAPGTGLVIAEGQLFDRIGPGGIPVLALAAGCPCCAGLLPLRVLLARALRKHRPRALLLLLRNEQHLPRVEQVLASGELGQRFEVDR